MRKHGPRGNYKVREKPRQLSQEEKLEQYKEGLSFYELQLWNQEKRRGKTDDEVKRVIKMRSRQ